MFAVIQTGGKQ